MPKIPWRKLSKASHWIGKAVARKLARKVKARLERLEKVKIPNHGPCVACGRDVVGMGHYFALTAQGFQPVHAGECFRIWDSGKERLS